MIDVFSGVVKVLKAKKDSIPNGWAKKLDVMTMSKNCQLLMKAIHK